jgi:ABC-type iron transport system FetAB permease component
MTHVVDAPTVQGEVHTPTVPSTSGAITVPIPGAVTQQIGSGEHAQNSIVYRTILWSFVGGGLLSAASIVIALCKGVPSALGYLFGKGR